MPNYTSILSSLFGQDPAPKPRSKAEMDEARITGQDPSKPRRQRRWSVEELDAPADRLPGLQKMYPSGLTEEDRKLEGLAPLMAPRTPATPPKAEGIFQGSLGDIGRLVNAGLTQLERLPYGGQTFAEFSKSQEDARKENEAKAAMRLQAKQASEPLPPQGADFDAIAERVRKSAMEDQAELAASDEARYMAQAEPRAEEAAAELASMLSGEEAPQEQAPMADDTSAYQPSDDLIREIMARAGQPSREPNLGDIIGAAGLALSEGYGRTPAGSTLRFAQGLSSPQGLRPGEGQLVQHLLRSRELSQRGAQEAGLEEFKQAGQAEQFGRRADLARELRRDRLAAQAQRGPAPKAMNVQALQGRLGQINAQLDRLTQAAASGQILDPDVQAAAEEALLGEYGDVINQLERVSAEAPFGTSLPPQVLQSLRGLYDNRLKSFRSNVESLKGMVK